MIGPEDVLDLEKTARVALDVVAKITYCWPVVTGTPPGGEKEYATKAFVPDVVTGPLS